MIHHGDLFDVLPTIQAESIDACVTDPPYGIGFMGKKWDTFEREPATSPFQGWTERWAREVLRVLKPGGHMLVCGAPRSYHRMACGLEDAGFEIRDCLAWIFGQGFPKSLNFEDGWGTALKPAYEPIVLARKPVVGTVAANRDAFGTGAINVDGCRIASEPWQRSIPDSPAPKFKNTHNAQGKWTREQMAKGANSDGNALGRWPANVAFDEPASVLLDEQSGELVSGGTPEFRASDKFRNSYGTFKGGESESGIGATKGGASRFFFVAKPSRSERDMGCHDLDPKQRDESRKAGNPGGDNPRNRGVHPRGNHHPTVKPIELMRWLVRLVTPKDGIVLDPFTGSGTTGCACAFELVKFIGIEREAEYVEIAHRRIASCAPLFSEVPA